MAIEDAEFDLHIWVKKGDGSLVDRVTVTRVNPGSQPNVGLAYDVPLDYALDAIKREIESEIESLQSLEDEDEES